MRAMSHFKLGYVMPIPYWILTRPCPSLVLGLDATTSNPSLGLGKPAPRFLVSFGCELSQTSLRSGMKLKGHSALSLPYLEPKLIIMISVMIPLNTNKLSRLILIRCDSTINKIILSYSYKIIFLPFLHSVRQWKSGDIKEGKRGRKWDFLSSPHLQIFFSNPFYTLMNAL